MVEGGAKSMAKLYGPSTFKGCPRLWLKVVQKSMAKLYGWCWCIALASQKDKHKHMFYEEGLSLLQ